MSETAWLTKGGCPLPEHDVAMIDWLGKRTTVDQAAIEQALRDTSPIGRLLHVGIGNSSLARTLAHRVTAIEGLTLSPREAEYAESLGFDNYTISVVDKYAVDYAARPSTFTIVVDNNPNSFACCWSHFIGLLQGYVAVLTPGSVLVTHETGLGWTRRGLDAREWSIEPERFERLALDAGFARTQHFDNGLILAFAPN